MMWKKRWLNLNLCGKSIIGDGIYSILLKNVTLLMGAKKKNGTMVGGEIGKKEFLNFG